MSVHVVLLKQNLTAYDTIHHGPSTTRIVSEHVFNTHADALTFYEQQKQSLRWIGDKGLYVTFPQEHDSYKTHTHTCDYCQERFSLRTDEEGQTLYDYAELPTGDFCSRACFRNSFQNRSSYDDEPYFESDY